MKPIACLLIFLASPALAALKTQTVEYKDGDAVMEGYLAYDDSKPGARPGVLVVHEWNGLGAYAKRRAEMLAQMGYVAFAADIYGKGLRAATHEEAAKLSAVYRNNRDLMRARGMAALEVLRRHPLTDPDRLAGVGYCFGGTTVLELVRGGAPLAGVASFHGSLNTPHPEKTGKIAAKVLILQGADDKFTLGDIPAFKDEMRRAGADFRIIYYKNAVHSFTVPDAGKDPSTGMAYNEQADRKSWKELKMFLERIFPEKRQK